MTNSVFDKTDKGREEIATRKYKLAPRLRTLLLLIDGKQPTADLLQKVSGMTEQSVAELLEDGFIKPVAVSESPAAAAAAQPAASFPALRSLPAGQTQYEAVYKFYTETISSTLGLRGYGLQLKVEKAASVDDFRRLREPYLEAVRKAKGNEMAQGMRLRLDELLYYGDGAASQPASTGLNAASK